MPDRMPEDLPVTKRINVMLGITRSKVFCILLYAYPMVTYKQNHVKQRTWDYHGLPFHESGLLRALQRHPIAGGGVSCVFSRENQPILS